MYANMDSYLKSFETDLGAYKYIFGDTLCNTIKRKLENKSQCPSSYYVDCTVEMYYNIIIRHVLDIMYYYMGSSYMPIWKWEELDISKVKLIETRLLKKYNRNRHYMPYNNLEDICRRVAYKILTETIYEEPKDMSEEYAVLHSKYFLELERDISKIIKYYNLNVRD